MRQPEGAYVSEADAQLLQQFQQGEAAAFDTLFLRRHSQVYRVAYGLVGTREQAEDLVQEAFLALYYQPPQLGGEDSLLAWLCRVALNRGYNNLRGERRARERDERVGRLEVAEQPGPEVALLRAEEQASVRAVLSSLPERQSRLLLLRYAGLSYAEIAAALELAPGSVGTLLARAEKAFAAAFAQSELPTT
ncbi:MAG: sigma-70 family RNA polymerase sigma factor [Roseiflexaceae bacterium]|nr:sigma-70 family RNA polymerase sigma factor [Roseiflexaceae bacterium]